jgi:hypothetical protein
MVGVGIGGVVMFVARLTVLMAVLMTVLMTVFIAVSLNRDTIGLAGPRAFPLAERATFCQSLHMVMVALLGPSNVVFKAQNLGPVLTKRAIHGGISSENLFHALSEGVHHHRVIA